MGHQDTKGPKQAGNQWALADETMDNLESEVATPEPKPKPPLLVEECAAWLEETLKTGPLTHGELKQRAKKAGFKENILQNARKRCPRIIDTLGPRRKDNRWLLTE